MIKEFLQRVYGPSVGWVFIAVGNKEQKKFSPIAYKYPGQLTDMVARVISSAVESDVYFCPHLFTSPTRKKENSIATIKWLWADKDNGDISQLQPKPTICWETSRGRYAALWELTDKIPSKLTEDLNKHIAYTTNSDKGGWDLTQFLRIPGTTNFKYSPAYQGSLLWDDGPKYAPDTFLSQLPQRDKEIDTAMEITVTTRHLPEHLPSFQEVVLLYGAKISPKVWKILNSIPEKDDDWSEVLWKLECSLFDNGLPPEAVFVLAQHSPYNKYARDNRPPEHLWDEIMKASAEKRALITQQGIHTGLSWMGINQLMAYSERPEWLVKDIWMDKNVGWIAGVGKSYKSTVSLDLALSIASGEPFLDFFEVIKPGPVLMVQEEDPAWRVAHRLQVMAKSKDINPVQVMNGDNTFSIEVPKDRTVPLFISIGGGFTLTDKKSALQLEEAIEMFRPRMVFLDPTFMLLPGIDEFKAGEVAEVLSLLKYWRNKYECAIAMVHHYNKSSGKSTSRLYGSMAFYAWSENSLFVDRVPDSNTVVIERDIKDALVDDRLEVTFKDIDKSYDFEVTQTSGFSGSKEEKLKRGMYVSTPSKDKVIRALRDVEEGEFILLKPLCELTDSTERTLLRYLTEFEALQFVELVKQGRGNTVHIYPLTRLYHMGDAMEGEDIND